MLKVTHRGAEPGAKSPTIALLAAVFTVPYYIIITFRVRHSRGEVYIGQACLCV